MSVMVSKGNLLKVILTQSSEKSAIFTNIFYFYFSHLLAICPVEIVDRKPLNLLSFLSHESHGFFVVVVVVVDTELSQKSPKNDRTEAESRNGNLIFLVKY